MRYFIDTEFREIPGRIDLISIGIVSSDGREYYAINRDMDVDAIWDDSWFKQNVIPSIYQDLGLHSNIYGIEEKEYWNRFNFGLREKGKTMSQIKEELLDFLQDPDEFWAYYVNCDWVVFCWIFGRMVDLPKGFPKYCRDLKQVMDHIDWDKEDTQRYCPKSGLHHNALTNAQWNAKLYRAIKQYYGSRGFTFEL